jgi:hypothetical protein
VGAYKVLSVANKEMVPLEHAMRDLKKKTIEKNEGK